MLKSVIKTSRQQAITEREKFLGVIQKWQTREVKEFTPSELLAGVREIFRSTAEYYNMAQSATIPTSMGSEAIFGMVYKSLIKRRNDPDAPTFLYGSENQAIRAEKALYDLAMWAKEQPELAEYLACTPADEIGATLQTKSQPAPVLREFVPRFDAYLLEFGHAIYDLDFAKSVPADDPTQLMETIKVYLSKKNNPYGSGRGGSGGQEDHDRIEAFHELAFLGLEIRTSGIGHGLVPAASRT